MYKTYTLVVLLALVPFTETALRCYTGYSIMKGSTIGTETKECEKESDSCYNGTAEVSSFSKLQKAGCNSMICRFHQNKCFEQLVGGQMLTFCCCDTGDMCNGGAVTEAGSLMDRGLSVLKGLVSAAAGKK